MEARELLQFVAFAAAVIRGALFAQPPNVTYYFDKSSCTLQVDWLPAETPNSSCIRKYNVAVHINGNWEEKNCLKNTYWNVNVPLDEKLDFDIQTSCSPKCADVSPWEKTFSVEQNGAAGTRARDFYCTWKNRKRMECLWLAGEKASPNTSYSLFYCFPSRNGTLTRMEQCKDFTTNGSFFQCNFSFPHEHVSSIVISVQGDSGNTQPLCLILNNINSLVTFDPPVITKLSKKDHGVLLTWNTSVDLSNLLYEVEVDNEQNPRTFQNTLQEYITVDDPNVKHTFRVRVRSNEGQWSAWSTSSDSEGSTSTFPHFLLVLIPLCVALLLVILLIYLKRIKLLILPKIPDPEKILKDLFEEHNEVSNI
ncbi:interleukin-13 receptor subunit alpha-1 isoform X2 [Paroedura picta]|uniref:interleukin-13 receptor subunit alpha-1 isoform X2 n=1 Tax=Paroedura picta TaxID=143630 RepID=UPI0040574C39